MNDGVFIDGSLGEGGGQILRTSLALSLVTGRPFRITAIRGRRNPPGLAGEHLAAIRAAARISGARVAGMKSGSTDLLFVPGPVEPGEYRVDGGEAGPASQLLQVLAVPLALASGSSRPALARESRSIRPEPATGMSARRQTSARARRREGVVTRSTPCAPGRSSSCAANGMLDSRM